MMNCGLRNDLEKQTVAQLVKLFPTNYRTLNVPYHAHSSSLLYPVTEPCMFLTMLTAVRYHILLQNPECSLPCSQQFATISCYRTLNVPYHAHISSLLYPVTEP